MQTLETLLSQQTIERLGWTLIHFVWQAMAVALLLAAILRCLRRSRPGVRYIISCLALILIVALPLVTMQLIEVSRPVAEVGPTLDVAPMADLTPVKVIDLADLPVAPLNAPFFEMPQKTIRVPWTQRVATALEPALPWLVLGWLLGVFGLSAWHLGGWAQLQRMKHRMVRDVAGPLHARLTDLSNRLGIRRTVGLLESALVEVPTVVGWVKPVILLPASVFSGLSAEQLEAILAHELAHVRRYDYLVNIGQTVIEILGFYHLGVWWISHRIRDERENCCDDLAVEICGDSRRYARALTCLEELRHRGTKLAVAANGGSLVTRVGRLLGRPVVDNRRFAWLPGLIALLVIMAILVPAALVLAGPDMPMPVNRVESEPNAPEFADEPPAIEATMQAPTDGEQADPIQILVRFKVFPKAVPDKALDRETRQLVGEILAAEFPEALEQIATRQNITLGEVLRTWVAGRLLTPDTLEVLVDILQSRGYLEGEATPELLAINNQQSTITIGAEEPARDPADPTTFKPITLGTTVRLTPHASSPTTDRITLEIAIEWKERIGPPDPNGYPAIRSAEIASTVTVLRDHYLTLLAEPDDATNTEKGSNEFHLVMFRADLLEPEITQLDATAPPVPPSDNSPRQVVLDVQTVAVARNHLESLAFEWSHPVISFPSHEWPSGIEMGYMPNDTFTQALLGHLNELCERGQADRMARQRLTTIDGHNARFKAVTEEWFARLPAQTEGALEATSELMRIASGTVVTATPTTGDDNEITLEMGVELRERLPRQYGTDLPVVTRRTSRNVVTLQNGGTVVLAGISRANAGSAKDVVILVTAHLAPKSEPVHTLAQTTEPPARKGSQPGSTALENSVDATRSSPVHVLLDCQAVLAFDKKVLDLDTMASLQRTLSDSMVHDDSNTWDDVTAHDFIRTQIASRILPGRTVQTLTDTLRQGGYVEDIGNPQVLAQAGRQVQLPLVFYRAPLVPRAPSALDAKLVEACADLQLNVRSHVCGDEQILVQINVQRINSTHDGGEDSSQRTSAKIADRRVTLRHGECSTIALAPRSTVELPGVVYVIVTASIPRIGAPLSTRPTSGAAQESSLEASNRRLDARGREFQQQIRDFLAGTPDSDAGRIPQTTDAATGSGKTDAVEVTARFLLVDPECLNALRRGLPIKGITTPVDVNALHTLGDDLTEGQTPLLEPDQVELLLKAVRQYTESKSLAAPKVTVLDGESATMSLTDNIRYVSGYGEPNEPSAEPIPQQVSKEIGVRLDATPQIIKSQNDIRLQFKLEINSLVGMQKALYKGKYEYEVPTFTTVTTATEIVVPDGQTALIHVGQVPSPGNTLGNESETPRPLLLLIRPHRTTVQPPDPKPLLPDGRHPGDPGMGGLPPGVSLR